MLLHNKSTIVVKEIQESEYEDSSDEGLIPMDARARKAKKERKEAAKLELALEIK